MKKSGFVIALALALLLALTVMTAYAATASVTITSPSNNATVSGSVSIKASCNGGSQGVSSVKYLIDGSGEIDMSGPNGSTSGTWSANWDSTKVANGSHTITCREYLSSGAAVTSSAITVKVSNSTSGGGGGTTTGSYAVIAYNDLGMHCACPNEDMMIMLPPFNTIRAQVIRKSSSPSVVTSGITVEYDSVENTEQNLLQDAEYVKWLDNAKYYYPTAGVSRTNIVGITGSKLDGVMKLDGNHWVAEGVPNYPAIDAKGIYDFFGQKRNPYLTANITVKDTAGTVLAKTSTVVPVSFGGCCSCHLKLAQNVLGISNPTPDQSFKVMCDAHKRDTGVDIYAMKPVKCSNCHADPAAGTTTNKNCTTTFSQALHLFHAKSTLVKSTYSANIDNDCYQCHPDAVNVKCFRGVHANTTINKWCSDCHGTILNRKDRTNYSTPWNYASLPKCGQSGCHVSPYTERITSTTKLFGLYLSSQGHHGGIDCLTCHGSPHAEQPSTMSKDNTQNLTLQNDARALGKCDVCHTDRGSTWGVPPHN